MAQLVKNPPAMQETQVWSLGGEDPLEKEMATHSSFLPGESHGQRSLVSYSLWDHKGSDITKWLNHTSWIQGQKPNSYSLSEGELVMNQDNSLRKRNMSNGELTKGQYAEQQICISHRPVFCLSSFYWMNWLDAYGSWAVWLFLTYQPVPFAPPPTPRWAPKCMGAHTLLSSCFSYLQLQQQGQKQKDSSLNCHENWSITLPGNSQKLLIAISSSWSVVNFL